ncbi:hypothetical protein ABH922_002396 [Rhodococcus sp. 27YEA15]|uniref:hypothetical protein n=1 Tax=Rhodococcus sp. 27YEA15 TaxID=3156259 RepID=UPI003C7E9A2E
MKKTYNTKLIASALLSVGAGVAAAVLLTRKSEPDEPVKSDVSDDIVAAAVAREAIENARVSESSTQSRRRLVAGVIGIPLIGVMTVIVFMIALSIPTNTTVYEGSSRHVWQGRSSGWLGLADSLTVNLYMLTVIATVNIAVSLTHPSDSAADQISTSFWAQRLSTFAFMTAVASVFVSISGWLSVAAAVHTGAEWSRENVGTATAVTVISVGCVYLAATISGKTTTDADRRLALVQIQDQLEEISIRRDRLNPGNKPDILHHEYQPTIGKYIPSAVTIVISSTIVSAVPVALVYFLTNHHPPLSNTLAVLILLALFNAGATSAVLFFTHARWTDTTTNPTWSQRIRPWTMRMMWFALVVFVVVGLAITGSSGSDADADAVVRQLTTCLGVLLTPVIPVLYLQVTRSRVSAGTMAMSEAPSWASIEVALRTRRADLEDRVTRIESLIAQRHS